MTLMLSAFSLQLTFIPTNSDFLQPFDEPPRSKLRGIKAELRRSQPVAALVSPSDLEHLERLRKAGPESGLASIAGGWENSEELASILNSSPRQGQRNIPDPEH